MKLYSGSSLTGGKGWAWNLQMWISTDVELVAGGHQRTSQMPTGALLVICKRHFKVWGGHAQLFRTPEGLPDAIGKHVQFVPAKQKHIPAVSGRLLRSCA